ncbi:MAG: hypothetical protein LBM67_02520 [Lentimicrobiaceae bacterium]|jgi:hypothetical protein|nr:hypothetical protein [Lentimicrobiaceae bacterium]
MSAGSQVALSAVLGGTAEALGGGKFANGAITGAFVMLFNHLQHEGQNKKLEGDRPQNNGEPVYTMDEFINENKGLTREEIVNQRKNRSVTFLDSQEGVPNMRYVINPQDGEILDMRHMLIVGKKPTIVGNLIEFGQWIMGSPSGMNMQDFYSNFVGSQFYRQYNPVQEFFKPTTFTDQMQKFFYGPKKVIHH